MGLTLPNPPPKQAGRNYRALYSETVRNTRLLRTKNIMLQRYVNVLHTYVYTQRARDLTDPPASEEGRGGSDPFGGGSGCMK